MANPEHLEILDQGVEVWNQWRRDYPEIRPQLDFGLFSKEDLRRANFGNVNLRSANLSGADLREADFTYADLHHANLHHANLRYANLRYATLSFTNLTSSDLSGSYLINSIFEHIEFTQTKFNRAILGFTNFVDTDLSKAIGLETVEFQHISDISLSTIERSQGKIPKKFLSCCRVREEFITYMRSLTVQPIQFYSCFISYSSKNQLFAERLYTDLQDKGVRCWLASEDLKIGEKIRIGIDESIRLHDKLLLVLSKYSVASDWVEQEVETALDRERKQKRIVLFPIRLDDTVMKLDTGWPALIKNTRNIGDFRMWKNPKAYQKAFDRLLRDLKAEEK